MNKFQCYLHYNGIGSYKQLTNGEYASLPVVGVIAGDQRVNVLVELVEHLREGLLWHLSQLRLGEAVQLAQTAPPHIHVPRLQPRYQL